jgi:hypothetical protein
VSRRSVGDLTNIWIAESCSQDGISPDSEVSTRNRSRCHNSKSTGFDPIASKHFAISSKCLHVFVPVQNQNIEKAFAFRKVVAKEFFVYVTNRTQVSNVISQSSIT